MGEERRQDEGGMGEIRTIIRDVIQEFTRAQESRAEPAHRAELLEERRRRETLERRVNELIEENRRSRLQAEEAERQATIRAELQRLGVAKAELAYRAVRDDILRADDGRLVAKTSQGELPVRDYIELFVRENPELLPARLAGGSGASVLPGLSPSGYSTVDIDKIRPGMNQEELERARQEIARVASQTLRGL